MKVLTKALLDECIVNVPKLFKRSNIIKSIHVVGKGAKDPTVLEYAIKNDLPLITADYSLSINAAVKKHPVYLYHKMEMKTYRLILHEVPLGRVITDSKTQHILEFDQVVRP